jgi:hypothetical protein
VTPPPFPAPGTGRLADNVLHFARVLRSAGMPVGTDRVLLAQQALLLDGLGRRDTFRAVLKACLLDRVEHEELFEQAFALFWRDPDLLGRMRALLLPKVQLQPGAVPAPKDNRRLGEALFPPAGTPPPPPPPDEVTFEATLTASAREVLRQADFETMTTDEWREARRMVAQLRPVFETLPTRRMAPATRPGQPDWRATLRRSARWGGEPVAPCWRAPREQAAPLVVLADISGSMSRHSRMLLHLAHTLRQAEARHGAPVESFVFGTRLTRITRLMARRDPDIAVAQVVRAVQDWSGGTRIGECLHTFNRRWARRVLPGHATVLLVTDGLERSDTAPAAASLQLSQAMAELSRRCRRLIWLNPLLRFRDFQPRASGVRAMLPHVHRFLPAHNVHSLAALVQELAGPLAAPAARPAARR